jgi:hypothetical protein
MITIDHHLRQTITKLLHDTMTTRLSPGDAVVIGGDFNGSETDPQLSAIKASFFVVQLKPGAFHIWGWEILLL